ncbi:MAG: FG-GAP-like repeat-containing protein [Rubricoccaceae bacterium]|nr:FG-GAP-like repeat-containing protein [Rubricoccaceae bacterium]
MPRYLVPLLLVIGAAVPAAGQPFFDAPWRAFHTGSWETGRYDHALAVADLNGDGLPDAAVGQTTFSGGIRVLFNEGDVDGAPATFTDDGVFYPTSRKVWQVVAADLDGDGDIDLAGSHTDEFHLNGTQVVVLRNTGTGIYGAPAYYAAGPAGPHGIEAADLDGDGDLDLAVANRGYLSQGTAVSILRNNGDGTFAPPVSTTVADGPNRLEAGDLDGDGDLDLAVGHEDEITVSVLLNDGTGAFGVAATYANLATGLNTLANGDVALADFDADGDLDIYYSNAGLYGAGGVEPQLAFLRNNGAGTFSSEIRSVGVAYESTPFSIESDDVNGDGFPDLVTAQHFDNGFFVLLGDGMGGFADTEMYAGAFKGSDGGGAKAVALADLDGDGDRDVLTVNGLVRLLTAHENLGDGTFPRRPVYGRVFLHSVLDVGDVDGDGDSDVATSHGGFFASGVAVHLNDGNGAFSTSLSTGGSYAFAKLRDLNGDGDLDLLYVSAPTAPPYDFFTRLGNGDGSFGAETRWPLGACGVGNPNAFDVDNDGDLDVVNTESRGCFGGGDASRLYISRNNGDGTFQPAYTLPGLGFPTFVEAADFNEDGALDLVTVASYPLVYFGNGDGTFEPYQQLPVGAGGKNVLALDLNGDGHVDQARLEVDARAEDRIAVLLGDGSGGFTTTVFTPTLQQFGAWITAGDVDGDGDPDLIGEGPQDAAVFLNDGSGGFTYGGRYGLGHAGYAPHYADFTGDGIGDLVALVLHNDPPAGTEQGLAVVPGLEGQPLAPLAVTAQPVGGPVTIGPGGGSFQFTATITNASPEPQAFEAWTAVTGPASREPVVGPFAVTLQPGQALTRTLTQRVPGSAPPGTYTYAVNVGTLGGAVTASDSFPFEKAAGAVREAGGADWAATGWGEAQAASALPGGFALSEARPNPSRGEARVTLEVSEQRSVRAVVYDALGRQVTVLHEGALEPGTHVLRLDATDLPAGVYVLRVEGEARTATRRITVLR